MKFCLLALVFCSCGLAQDLFSRGSGNDFGFTPYGTDSSASFANAAQASSQSFGDGGATADASSQASANTFSRSGEENDGDDNNSDNNGGNSGLEYCDEADGKPSNGTQDNGQGQGTQPGGSSGGEDNGSGSNNGTSSGGNGQWKLSKMTFFGGSADKGSDPFDTGNTLNCFNVQPD